MEQAQIKCLARMVAPENRQYLYMNITNKNSFAICLPLRISNEERKIHLHTPEIYLRGTNITLPTCSKTWEFCGHTYKTYLRVHLM